MKILFISLGCDKNLVDTEVMLGMLASRGYEMTNDEQEADIIVINTCCFIHDAKEESIQNILEMAEYKKNGSAKALIVTGCMAERYRQEILDEIPEVDEVLGTTAYDRILDAVDAALAGQHEVMTADLDALPLPETKRLVTTGGHFAYLKIAEGCDNRCSFCAIPLIRGGFRSRRMEDILEEARGLAASGVKELNLVAQDTTRYGQDLYGEYSLDKLLTELCKIDGFHWIRVLYGYPDRVTDSLLEVMAEFGCKRLVFSSSATERSTTGCPPTKRVGRVHTCINKLRRTEIRRLFSPATDQISRNPSCWAKDSQ